MASLVMMGSTPDKRKVKKTQPGLCDKTDWAELDLN
jgi:hypothetical protein